MKNRIHLTKEQRLFIKFLHQEDGLSPERIREHQKLLKPDGSPYQLKVIKFWINRIDESDGVEYKRKTGRPRKLTQEQEDELIKFIEDNGRLTYRKVKYKKQLPIKTRTVNDYALRHKISKY